MWISESFMILIAIKYNWKFVQCSTTLLGDAIDKLQHYIYSSSWLFEVTF